MADDKNGKKLISNAGERAKGAFTGEDGSIFWACKEIYNALKIGLHALNTQLSRAGRAVAEIQEKSLNNTDPSADNRLTGEDLAEEAIDGAYYGAEDALDYRERTQRRDSDIDGFTRRDRFGGDPTDLQ